MSDIFLLGHSGTNARKFHDSKGLDTRHACLIIQGRESVVIFLVYVCQKPMFVKYLIQDENILLNRELTSRTLH